MDPYVRQGLVWLTPKAYTTVAIRAQKRFGYLGWNTVDGPAAFTLNGGLHKTFALTERQRLTFRLEAFNALNHPLMANPVVSYADANFGKIITASGNRNVQLALKYTF